jgi:hypothetical protein
MAVLFEMVNYAATYDAIYVAKDFRRFKRTISYRMKVVWHYDVRINGKARRFSGLIESFAGYDLDPVGPKYWKAVLGYSSNIQSRCIS